MPIYRVTIAGTPYDVEVPDPTERPVRAIVNGQVLEVEVAPDITHGASGPIPGPAPSAPVASAQPPPARPAPMPQTSRRGPSAVATQVVASGDGAVFAPLPGTIVSISVVEGETVTRGQELCILEAMKMNNPIRATQAGVVTEIHVSVGEQVQHGVPLMVIGAPGSSKEV